MISNSREISLKRAETLKSRIEDYTEARKTIPTGLKHETVIKARKAHIMKRLNATGEDWDNYKWQLKHRVDNVDTLKDIIHLEEDEIEAIQKISKLYRWSISPYYLSLIDPSDMFDPIKLLSVPNKLELADKDAPLDPMNEEFTNPAGTITRRYPDRLIINVINECAMYCRHCQRRRNIGHEDEMAPRKEIEASIQYIKDTPEIRDVLVTGGDPLTLSDKQLDWILSELHAIEHVEMIRIGSRTLVTMPQRITDSLVNILKKYPPIYINTHFNHPMEITQEAKQAAEKLANAGIPLGNQAVLLNGINNDKFVMRVLNHEMLKIRVRPYYIFHAKTVQGTHHLKTSLDDGLEILEYLRGYTSGMAIPTYIVNAPGKKKKTPMLPQYLISRGQGFFTIRTWEGEILQHENHDTIPIKEQYDNLK